MAIQAAAAALTVGEGTELIHQAALQLFPWWFPPRQYPEDEWDGVADATAELLEELGMGRLAGIARSGQTTVVLDAWAAGPHVGAAAFPAAHGDSGVDPPDTPLLTLGPIMGMTRLAPTTRSSAPLPTPLLPAT